ncbi:MAG TPA: NAD(P)H-dependent oxidoreductase subunit E [bacterium]|nr:NAD(P)H-dependent oxidoreductase subunit E [bacterium]
MTVDEDKEVLEKVREILASNPDGYRNLISILQETQEALGYLPRAGMIEIANHLGISPANVYGVASFYNQFRFKPPGKCHIQACMGTACHIKQGDLILDQWKRRLEIEEGERTADGEFSIERVACVGACAMAPVSIVCKEVIGHMAVTKVDGILLQNKLQKEQEEREKLKHPPASEHAGDKGQGR